MAELQGMGRSGVVDHWTQDKAGDPVSRKERLPASCWAPALRPFPFLPLPAPLHRAPPLFPKSSWFTI